MGAGVAAVLNPEENARSYSSVYRNQAAGGQHARSMLDSALGWAALTNTVDQYVTISLGSVHTVQGVVTQGRADGYSQWVTSYKVQTSRDCSVYSYVDVDGGRVFSGNVDMSSKVQNDFNMVVEAWCVRLMPQTWSNHISMRAGVVSFGRPVSSLPLTQ